MIVEIKCPHCKKNFIRNPQSVYKIVKNGKTIYLCSYTCYRAEVKIKEDKKNKKKKNKGDKKK